MGGAGVHVRERLWIRAQGTEERAGGGGGGGEGRASGLPGPCYQASLLGPPGQDRGATGRRDFAEPTAASTSSRGSQTGVSWLLCWSSRNATLPPLSHQVPDLKLERAKPAPPPPKKHTNTWLVCQGSCRTQELLWVSHPHVFLLPSSPPVPSATVDRPDLADPLPPRAAPRAVQQRPLAVIPRRCRRTQGLGCLRRGGNDSGPDSLRSG